MSLFITFVAHLQQGLVLQSAKDARVSVETTQMSMDADRHLFQILIPFNHISFVLWGTSTKGRIRYVRHVLQIVISNLQNDFIFNNCSYS